MIPHMIWHHHAHHKAVFPYLMDCLEYNHILYTLLSLSLWWMACQRSISSNPSSTCTKSSRHGVSTCNIFSMWWFRYGTLFRYFDLLFIDFLFTNFLFLPAWANLFCSLFCCFNSFKIIFFKCGERLWFYFLWASWQWMFSKGCSFTTNERYKFRNTTTSPTNTKSCLLYTSPSPRD